MASDWPELLKRIELKFPFSVDAKAELNPLDPKNDDWMITVSMHVPDVLSPNELTAVHTCGVYPSVSKFPDEENGAMRAVRSLIRRALMHEMDESIWLDGERYFNPHADEEKAAA